MIAVEGDVGALDRALILAPYRRDAAYLEILLVEHGIPVTQCQDVESLAAQLVEPPALLVVTHEALSPAVVEVIAKSLIAQADWSEMPIIVLLDRAASHARIRAQLAAAWPRSRQLFYQRPVAALELVSGIQAALLARVRQRDVRDRIEREIELRHELNHRVKNILASVSSMFEMTRRGTGSIDRLAVDFGGRLAALADVHSAVFRSGGEAIPVAEVVDLTFTPYRSAGEDRITVSGPEITISREAATTLALCLHELATNAIKYGSLSRPEGRVSFVWNLSSDPDPILTIEWIESGGPPVSEPSRSGYGTRYLRGGLASLFGKIPDIAFLPEGLRCVASGPFSRISMEQPSEPGVHGR